MSKTCYMPLKGVDDVIATALGWSYTGTDGNLLPDIHRVANLRAMYESKNKALNLDNINEVIGTLKNYARTLAIINARKINIAANNTSKSYDKLRRNFGYRERQDRINMIATYFTDVLNDYQKRHPNIPREALIKGFRDKNGVFIGGQAAIFDEVYNRLMRNRSLYYYGSQLPQYSEENRQKFANRFDAISKVLDPELYSSLVARARFILKDTEGIILGQKFEYCATASFENYDSSDLDEAWETSEAKREGWMEKSDEKSAFESVGLQVRRFLSTIPQIELVEESNNGVVTYKKRIVKDDLGCTRYIDAAEAHSNLIDLLRGVQDEEHLIKLLTNKDGEAKQLWLSPVVDELRNNHQLRTQFFRDFKKGFQPYSIFFEDKAESRRRGVSFYKTYVINRITGLLNSSYKYRISFGKKLSKDSIFEDSSIGRPGAVNWVNLGKLKDKVYEWVHETNSNNILAPSNAKLLQKGRGKDVPSKADKINFLAEVFQAMGIEANISTIEKIVTSNDIYKVHRALSDYFDAGNDNTGITLVLSGNDVSKWKNGEYSSMSHRSMRDLYTTKHKPEDKLPKLQEHTEKILDIVAKHQEGLRMEKRVRFGDKTRFSNVDPCYLSDKLEAIERYVKENAKDKLREYLMSEYCDNSFLCERYPNGKLSHVYNMWLQELLDCCDTPDNIRLEDTFAGNFTFERDLGNTEQEFEDFTSKTHAIDMLIRFFSDKQQNKKYKSTIVGQDGKEHLAFKSSALYPVFVLGDSGVSKYIRAPRIQEDNGEWGEKSKNKIIDALYEVYCQELRRMHLMDKMNKKLANDGYKGVRSTKEFSVLQFLNEDEYKLPDNPKVDDVKAVIRKFMDDATNTFIGKLDALEVTKEQVKDGKPTGRLLHLDQVATPKTLHSAMEDFYWNTKLATIQQLQLMTIDPSFYKGTKDLQKRYKEIHAPGTKLSLLARNPFKKGNPYFNADINGVPKPETCMYFDDIEVDVEETDPDFAEAIKAHPRTAKYLSAYRESSLTDGQGLRSLESYRKVLGMAGLWTQEMENLYDDIMTLRQIYGKRVPKKTDSDFDDYMARISSIANRAVIFQPIKPFMFTHEVYTINNGTATNYADKMLIPVQHKYAEAVLIPELLPEGSKLRDMAYWMDEHVEIEKDDDGNIISTTPAPIDLVCATTVVKVGNFGATNIKGINDRESFLEALNKGYVHKLSYEDYRIQTNVPEHMNSSQLFGTQIRKLIMSHLKFDKSYNYLKNLRKSPKTINLGGRWKDVDAQNLKGRNLLALYNSLIVANIFEDYEKFANEVGDIHKLADILLQSVLSNNRESMDNLLSYALTGDDKFLVPLFEGGLEHDSAALILSMFKKRVNKQSIKGGSAVQVSAFGIHGYEESGDLKIVADPNDKSNLLYMECEVPFMLDYYDTKTKSKVALDYDTYCNMDGTLKVGKYLDKSDPEYNKYLSYEDDKGVYKPLIEMHYPDILSFVAYRIPTERAYSMLNLKIKRFSRKTAGGIIKVPAQATKIAGFDFDIDKLYFILREFIKHSTSSQYDEQYFSKQDRYDIYADIYKQHPEIAIDLEIARTKVDPEGKTPLHSYWKEAEIEEKYGFNKQELFEYTARELELEPETKVAESNKEYFEEYDFTKTPEQNTRAARNNLLIDLMQARLSDKETFDERYTPGGFANASIAARKLRELLFGDTKGLTKDNILSEVDRRVADKSVSDPEPNYDPSDPMTIIVYNQQNQVAGKLIGIFANQNTNHAFASLMHSFTTTDEYVIEFAGHKYNKDKVGKDFLNPPQRQDGNNDVDLYMAELLAASVDAVKDPVLNFLNLNTITADSGAVLIRLGYTTEEVGLLFNQPIIKKLCENCFNENLNVGHAIDSLLDDLSKHSTTEMLTDNLTKEHLASNILEDRKARDAGDFTFIERNAASQIAVLKLFKKINEISSDVSSFVTSTKFTASNAVSSTFGGMYAQQMRVADYVSRLQESYDNTKGTKSVGSTIEMQVVEGNPTMDAINDPISNREDLLTKKKSDYMDTLRMNPFAYEQAMFDMNRKAVRLLAPAEKGKKALYPYGRNMYVGARTLLKSLSLYGLDDETIDDMHRDLLVYCLAMQENSLFCGEIEHGKTGMSNRYYYERQFAKDMFTILDKYPQYAELEIFKYIRPEEVTDNDGKTIGYNILIQDVGGIKGDIREMIKESWSSMVETDENGRYINPEIANLAIDLFVYNFYKLGYDFGHVSFMNLAPTAVKEVIKVPRANSIPVNKFTETNADKGDVYVFYPGNSEHSETAWNDYGFEAGVDEGLRGDAYALPIEDKDGNFNIEAFKRLCIEAQSNPDRIFKVQTVINQYEIDAMADAKVDIPSNIQFTEESVVNNDWTAVNYGVNRTYLEFLNEILDGTYEGINTLSFIKQFLLNHLDNYRFILNTNAPHLKKFINEKVKPSVFGKYKERITIKVDSVDESIQKAFVKVKYGNEGIISATWKPIIKITDRTGDHYYMAADGLNFNVNKSLSMEYELVSPYGVKGTSKMYKSDITIDENLNKDQDPIETPGPKPQEPTSLDSTVSRSTLERIIKVNMIASLEGTYDDAVSNTSEEEKEQTVNKFMKELKLDEMSDTELGQFVENLRVDARNNGITFLDEDGKAEKSC